MVDVKKRDELVRRFEDFNKRNEPALVTLEEFFDGNDDGSSIWCNLADAPKPAIVYKFLSDIRGRADVNDVLVMMTQYDGGEDDWVFSDTVYVFTSASAGDVNSWFDEDHAPDEAYAVEASSDAPASPIVACWWD